VSERYELNGGEQIEAESEGQINGVERCRHIKEAQSRSGHYRLQVAGRCKPSAPQSQ